MISRGDAVHSDSSDLIGVSLPPHAVSSDDPSCWELIYDSAINLAICARTPAPEVRQFAEAATRQSLAVALALTDVDRLDHHLPKEISALPGYSAWVNDVAFWIEAMQCLFDVDSVGLRLRTLDAAMCPRFHVDHTPVRLVTTYGNPATEWLPNEAVERSQLGQGGLLLTEQRGIRRLPPFSVALMKGEAWEGNEGRGLVHRSPQLSTMHRRLLLTLDTMS
jgi:hypothetical protein